VKTGSSWQEETGLGLMGGKSVKKNSKREKMGFHDFAMTVLMRKLGPEIGGAFRLSWGGQWFVRMVLG